MRRHGSTAIGCSPKPWVLRLLRRPLASQSKARLKPQLLELLEDRKPEEARLPPSSLCPGSASDPRCGGGCLTGRADARCRLWRAGLAQALFADDKPHASALCSYRRCSCAPRTLVGAGVGRGRIWRKLPSRQNDVGDATALGERFPRRTGSTAHPLPRGLDQCKLDAIWCLGRQRRIDPIHEGLECPARRRRPNTIDFPIVAADTSQLALQLLCQW